MYQVDAEVPSLQIQSLECVVGGSLIVDTEVDLAIDILNAFQGNAKAKSGG